MAHPTAARRLARFVVGFGLDEIPVPVGAKATRLALDALGNCLAASREAFGRAVLGVAERLGGPPESTLIGRPAKVAAAKAVLANATLAHGLDFDDTREDAIVHPGCVAVTTALAVGEAVGATGRAVLEALIAGVEVMCRVGLAVPGALHARHFHPTAIAGSFAAAAASAKLSGLSENQLVHAFGICGSQAGGIIGDDGGGNHVTVRVDMPPGSTGQVHLVLRIADTRGPAGPTGGPKLDADTERAFPERDVGRGASAVSRSCARSARSMYPIRYVDRILA